IGTGKPLGPNPFGSAAPAFAFAPGCQGDAGRRMVGGSRSRLATGWAIRRRTGLEEPLARGGDGGGLEAGPQLRPVPAKPKREDAQHQAGPEPIDQHSVPRHTGARLRGSIKDSEASWGRQVVRKKCCTELSTVDRGRTSTVSFSFAAYPIRSHPPI